MRGDAICARCITKMSPSSAYHLHNHGHSTGAVSSLALKVIRRAHLASPRMPRRISFCAYEEGVFLQPNFDKVHRKVLFDFLPLLGSESQKLEDFGFGDGAIGNLVDVGLFAPMFLVES